MKLFSEEELAHFGVLGMKWGVRKDRGNKPSLGQRIGKRVHDKNVGKGPLDPNKLSTKAIKKVTEFNVNRASKKKAHRAVRGDQWDNNTKLTRATNDYKTEVAKARNDKFKAIETRTGTRKSRNTEYKTAMLNAKTALKATKKGVSKDYWEKNAQVIFGNGGVSRIKKRMDKGVDSHTAHKIEAGQSIAKYVLASAAINVAVYAALTKLT